MMAMTITARHVVTKHHISHGTTISLDVQKKVAIKQVIVVRYAGYTITRYCDIKRKGIRMQKQSCNLIHHKEQTTHNAI